MKLLLEEGKSPLNATDADGSTALHHAISEGHGEAALVLLRAGAEPGKRDRDEKFAIDLAPDSKVSYCLQWFRSREVVEKDLMLLSHAY